MYLNYSGRKWLKQLIQMAVQLISRKRTFLSCWWMSPERDRTGGSGVTSGSKKGCPERPTCCNEKGAGIIRCEYLWEGYNSPTWLSWPLLYPYEESHHAKFLYNFKFLETWKKPYKQNYTDADCHQGFLHLADIAPQIPNENKKTIS